MQIGKVCKTYISVCLLPDERSERKAYQASNTFRYTCTVCTIGPLTHSPRSRKFYKESHLTVLGCILYGPVIERKVCQASNSFRYRKYDCSPHTKFPVTSRVNTEAHPTASGCILLGPPVVERKAYKASNTIR